MNIDFEKLQADVATTRQMVEALLGQLNQQPKIANTTEEDNLPLSIQQAADFLNISRQTIYQNIARIPHRKRHGRLYFFKNELSDYLNKAV
jgi:predicted DNA-binding protein YlxM (UPF0122 family)